MEGFELPVLAGVGPALWPHIANVVVEVADRHGDLSAVTALLKVAGMTTIIHQAPKYRGTELYTVYAWREDQ